MISRDVGSSIKREIGTLSVYGHHKPTAKQNPGLAERSISSSGYDIIALKIFDNLKPTISGSHLSSLNRLPSIVLHIWGEVLSLGSQLTILWGILPTFLLLLIYFPYAISFFLSLLSYLKSTSSKNLLITAPWGKILLRSWISENILILPSYIIFYYYYNLLLFSGYKYFLIGHHLPLDYFRYCSIDF